MDGVINLLKPPGMSSGAAVGWLRRLLDIKKVGHAGTLDPGACGVLPICVGKATRISAYLMDAQKEYVAEVAFGQRTDTGDSYGAVTETSPPPYPGDADVMRALAGFQGRVTQQTPAYSASKVDGKKRYELARSGKPVPPQPRVVEIVEIEYLGRTRGDAHRFRVVCGKGTYIRALCEDVGRALGVCAHMSFLARTQCAGLNIAEAFTLDELGEDAQRALLPIARFLGRLPRAEAAPEQRERLCNGVAVPVNAPDAEKACIYAGDELLGIGRVLTGEAKINTRLVDA